ncbi:2-amino-4-hydroxy-6-hydroxymethyldihydropteridine diphosphokinase [Ereboglobus sp. PH5-5]|uniref:2-amino-4-hydroxy-6- hydroxymethyldihydropteridine diphosphokinase n=1 Tax=Ereboglobus sp. PH5-5 TaxID=2940529 RepID=UPI0024062B4F|nr:2-amino-4-hydroxy-6-hydroxymethyldihydropteridine diphosphokinase [Ereboglobus sp. PH5-5]MDF9833873.1 2-amino-4-hydroxy-6-hydroxymethyldihydropteridine diphosphokinase [Ereboglobus sp. PH5-5]
MSGCVAYISAGSNLGDREATLRGALRALGDAADVRVDAVSAIYETDPVGGVEQPAYLNLAARLGVGRSVSPEALLGEMQRIERAFGRRRENEVRWGPRTLDLDLLLFGDVECASETLALPHPRMWERAFVLIPLREVAEVGLLGKLDQLSRTDPSVRLFSVNTRGWGGAGER